MNSQKIGQILVCGCIILASSAYANDPSDIASIPQGKSNVRLNLEIADNRSTFRIEDSISFCYSASEDGYITLWDKATNGTFQKLYPFKSSPHYSQYIRRGTRECVGGGDTYTVKGPTGTEDVILIWSETPQKTMPESFRNNKEFSHSLERTIAINENVDNTKLTSVSFEIINQYDTAQTPHFNPSQILPTIPNHSGQVYILAFGANVGLLTKTNEDAKLFTQTVQASFNVPVSNIQLYPNAYRDDFVKGFRWLQQSAGPNDTVFVFYSGHGSYLPDDNNDEEDHLDEALVPYDIEVQQDFSNEDLYIRDDQLAEWLNAINSQKTVLVLDSCFSGGLYRNGLGVTLGARSKFFRDGIDAMGIQAERTIQINHENIFAGGDQLNNGKTQYAMIAAAQESETALEKPTGGVFTMHLTDALRKGNYQDWNDMFERVKTEVVRTTNAHQTPVKIDPDNVLRSLKF